MKDLKPKQNCKSCGFGISWRDVRAQFGRLMRKGKTKEEAKELLPRCKKCLTVVLKAEPQK